MGESRGPIGVCGRRGVYVGRQPQRGSFVLAGQVFTLTLANVVGGNRNRERKEGRKKVILLIVV